MSKYERLDNNYNNTDITTTISTKTAGESTTMRRISYHDHADDDYNGDDDDDDDVYNDDNVSGNYKMLIENNHSNNGNNYNRVTGNSYNNHNNNNNNNSHNNNNNSNNNNHNINLEPDESTMEVPLLHNNNNNDHDYELNHQNACRCNQPGFTAHLTRKSTQDAKIKIIFAISLCGIFMIVEFLGGYLAGSLAIMTDAAHLASDCISFVIGLVAIWLGGRPPDRRMSFGYKRMEVMGAIVSILGIWILTATLVIVAIERIYSNDYDLDANTMMVISGIGILINVVMAYILHGSPVLPGGTHHGHSHAHAHAHSHSHKHSHTHKHSHAPQMDNALLADGCSEAIIGNGLKHTNGSCDNEKNLNLRAAMIHVIGDLVQSIGVFLASILIKFFPSAKFVDPLCTLLFSVIVILTTVALFKESVQILMDAVPHGISMEDLEMDLSHIEGVKSVHHLNVWNHTSNYSVMMVHLVIDLLTDSNMVLEKATSVAHSKMYNIKHTAIQIERLSS